MATAKKITIRWLFVASCSLLFSLQALPVSAGVIFSDNFNRSDDATVGNGWTEVDDPPLTSSIASGALKMEMVSGANKDTRIYRVGTQHNDIILSGTLTISFSGSGGPQQVPRVVVRSNGTGGTGPGDHLPCGIAGTTPPNCWEGDGFGFSIFADKDASPNVRIQIVDDGTELAELSNFSFPTDTTHQWEMQINALNHVAVFVWTGAKPSVPTLEFTNGGNPYVPLANGNNWQIEVKNVNVNSRSHTALWDDFQVATLAPSCVGFDPPMDNGAVTVKKNKVLPLKAELLNGNGNPITDADVIAPPVIQVFFYSGILPAVDVTDQALSAGQGTDGNQFEFSDGKWRFNLQTMNYTAAGTYTITMVSGDDSEYTIDPTCIAEFVIE
jgi:hypothetical protein